MFYLLHLSKTPCITVIMVRMLIHAKGMLLPLFKRGFFFLKKSFVFKEKKFQNSPHVVKTLLLVLVDFCSLFFQKKPGIALITTDVYFIRVNAFTIAIRYLCTF